MISDEKEAIVLRLAEKGMTERQIEKQSGVSRNTIRKIIKSVKAAREAQRAKGPHNKSHESQPIRCPNCRYVVVLPCVVCGYRRKKKFKVSRYRDNLFLSISYPTSSEHILPHTRESEDAWDDAYVQQRPWMREQSY